MTPKRFVEYEDRFPFDVPELRAHSALLIPPPGSLARRRSITAASFNSGARKTSHAAEKIVQQGIGRIFPAIWPQTSHLLQEHP